LLDPVEIPELREAAILVELHDFVTHDITEKIRSRFGSTHKIHHIWQEAEPRSPSDFPWQNLITAMLPRYYLSLVVSEMRPTRMAWFWMEPHC
jgi:sterol desaturase/sphingolipid hydroxylase (fatty acid hydroxylase superfamily)